MKGGGKSPDQPGRFEPQIGVAFNKQMLCMRSGRLLARATDQ